MEIIYLDDRLSPNSFRQRILFTAWRGQFSVDARKSFIQKTQKTGCLYLQHFTTSRRQDKVWAPCGAWRYPDAPALMHGRPDLADKLLLHRCDRENWTYLVGGRSREVTASSFSTSMSLNEKDPNVT